MQVYFPSYYNKFSCIADACGHSCCVGWEILLDTVTEKRLMTLGDEVARHISHGTIKLCDDGRCPFLTESGLCTLICGYGEDVLSDICHHHPRFYHRVGDRIEGGIGASCEEACRLILSSDDYSVFLPQERDCTPPEETNFDTLTQREWIYSVLSDRGKSFEARIKEIKERYDLRDLNFDQEVWNGVLLDIEYLYESNRGRFSVGKAVNREENHPLLERFFAYLLFRHVSIADSREDFRARLGFCLLLTSILEKYLSDRDVTFEETVDFVRALSEEIEYSEENTESLIFEITLDLI